MSIPIKNIRAERITGSLDAIGISISGSLSGSFSGSLEGTASFALTSSFVTPLIQQVQITGSLEVTGSTITTFLTASGLNYPSSDNGEESFIQTDGNGNLSLQYVKTIYEEIVNGETTQLVKGTPVYVSGSQGAASIVYRADAGDPSKMPVIYISADTLAAGEAGRGVALGLFKGVDTTGYPAGTEVYVGVGGGWTSTRPTGSAEVQVLGYVTKEGNGGQGVVLNSGPNSLPNIPSGSVWVGNSDGVPVSVLTSSLSVASASFAQTASFVPGYVSGSGTSGQVAFFNGATTQTGDNGLFWDNTNKRLGVGTNVPLFNLHVLGVGRFESSAGTGRAAVHASSDFGFNTISQISQRANFYGYYTQNPNSSIGIGGNAQSNTSIQAFNYTNNLATGLSLQYYGGNVVIGSYTGSPTAKLHIAAQGALSTDIAFRVRNSADTADLMSVDGIGQTILTPTALTGTSATSALDITQTWNTTGTPTAIRLNVTNTASNGNSRLIDIISNGTSRFSVNATATNITGNLQITSGNLTGVNTFQSAGGFNQPTTGEVATYLSQTLFNPTSGNATRSAFSVTNTINQTGTATGITRGLYINPTLTSAADFRAIELTNNTGFGIYQSGTANNSFAGNVGIGTTNPTQALDVTGVIRGVLQDPTGVGGVTAKLLSYSISPYGLVFRGYATGQHSIQNQREDNDGETYPLVLQPNGNNVGIGTVTPNAKLDVNGNTIISGSLEVTNGITGSLFGTASYAQTASYAPNYIEKSVGPTYTTNAILTVTQAEYDAIDPKDSTTLYFII